MNTITQAKLDQLHKRYTSYKEQYLSNEDAIYYATRDLGLPSNFNITDYTIVEAKEVSYEKI